MSCVAATPDGSQTHVFPPLYVFPNVTINSTHVSSHLDQRNHDKAAAAEEISVLKGSDTLPEDWPTGCRPEAPDKVVYAASASGNVNSAIIYNYFKGVFIPSLRAKGYTGPVILVGDMHGSHLSLKLLKYVSRSNVARLATIPRDPF
jgi:hypothetical protein